MSNFVWFSPERFNGLEEHETVDGTQIVISLSPYETPKGIEGEYDAPSGCLILDFRYIDDEPASPAKMINGAKFYEGQYSGKLLKLEIPVEQPPYNHACIIEIQTKLVEAIDQQSRKLDDRIGQRLNFDAAKSVINNDLRELVGN